MVEDRGQKQQDDACAHCSRSMSRVLDRAGEEPALRNAAGLNSEGGATPKGGEGTDFPVVSQ